MIHWKIVKYLNYVKILLIFLLFHKWCDRYIGYSVWWSKFAIDEDLSKQIKPSMLITVNQFSLFQAVRQFFSKIISINIFEFENFQHINKIRNWNTCFVKR